MTVEKITGETTSLALLLAIKETGIGKSDHVLCQFSWEPPRSWNGVTAPRALTPAGRRRKVAHPTQQPTEQTLPSAPARASSTPSNFTLNWHHLPLFRAEAKTERNEAVKMQPLV